MLKESKNHGTNCRRFVYTLMLFLAIVFSGCTPPETSFENSGTNTSIQATPVQTPGDTLPVMSTADMPSLSVQPFIPTETPAEAPFPIASTEVLTLPTLTSTLLTSTISIGAADGFETTPTTPISGNVLFRLAFGQSYNWIDFERDRELADPQYLHRPGKWINSQSEEPGPSDAFTLSFSHYQNKVAYWTQDKTGQLWLSDLELASPQLIFSDDTGTYLMQNYGSSDLELIWTPDDRHLILDMQDEAKPDLIYHLNTEMIEPWPWYCNRVAISTKTDRLSIWCESTNNGQDFAVIEWGGDIWYSKNPPRVELVRLDKSLQTHWAWSSDGEKIAFFDPQDSEGYFTVANSQGVLAKYLPGSAWWSNEDVLQSKISIPKQLLQWSQDNNVLLIYANGQTENSCPLWANFSASGPEVLYKIPCWQVIDAQNGAVLWTIASSIDDEEMAKYWQFNQATLSREGEFLALSAWFPGFFWTGIVDLNDGSIYWWDTGTSVMQWANLTVQ